MDINDMIRQRKSVRSYTGEKVPTDILREIVDAARWAPTARGVQPWEFIVVTDNAVLECITSIVPNGPFIKNAGSLVAVFCKDTMYYLEDGAAATENILLAAAGMGVGSCWVAGDKKDYADKVGKLLGVPVGYKLVSLISLGYEEGGEGREDRGKRSLEEVLHWEKF